MGRQNTVPVIALCSLMLMTLLLMSGCGLKADPVPRQIRPLKAVTDVRIQEEAGGIVIRWRLPEQPRPVTRFEVYRSEFGPDGEKCPGCPPDETRIAGLADDESKRVSGEDGAFGYRDGDLNPGRLYRYRVIACDGGGFCSVPSAPVEWRMPGALGAP
jgi:hypothetical protein